MNGRMPLQFISLSNGCPIISYRSCVHYVPCAPWDNRQCRNENLYARRCERRAERKQRKSKWQLDVLSREEPWRPALHLQPSTDHYTISLTPPHPHALNRTKLHLVLTVNSQLSERKKCFPDAHGGIMRSSWAEREAATCWLMTLSGLNSPLHSWFEHSHT